MDMEGIVALILAGSIFKTTGTWAITRLISIIDCVVAAFYAYTPLRMYLGWVWLGMLIVTLGFWAVNVARLPRMEKNAK